MSGTKNKSVRITGLLLAIMTGTLAYAFSDGITGYTMKPGDNGDGCFCHTPNPSAAVQVLIEGPETLEPGVEAEYQLIITGGPLSAAGANIAASLGELTAGEGLKKVGNELTHQLPKLPQSGSVTFTFSYTAPAVPGEAIIWANGNSVNFNGQNTQDQWNFAPNKIIKIETPTGLEDAPIAADWNLEQNYPNPFNPETRISYSMKEAGEVEISVYDAIGALVATLNEGMKNAGNHETVFNASELNSGIYFYTIRAGKFTQTKKMILLK